MNEFAWRKSSYSEGGQGCITIGETPTVTHVRDSKDMTIPGFSVPVQSWAALVEYAKKQNV
ncbi:DUF397 domain-containing protein [Rhodococcus qingshengii]|uniref:DUF397 domain-containing protein n=1 Tax=Rhodococcus qingshengii TaxID=334542 RepID=UPI0035DB4F50